MPRVSRGALKGKSLKEIPNSSLPFRSALRPTSSMTRAVLFNILAHNPKVGFGSFESLRVLDLCCGTGMVGIEFLSLGGEEVVFVDSSYNFLEKLHQNLSLLGLDRKAKILMQKLPAKIAQSDFDVIFFDPPYKEEAVLLDQLKFMFPACSRAVAGQVAQVEEGGNVPEGRLVEGHILSQEGVFVVEIPRCFDEPELCGLELMLSRPVNKKTKLLFYKRGKTAPDGPVHEADDQG